jgi:hypothetical protein
MAHIHSLDASQIASIQDYHRTYREEILQDMTYGIFDINKPHALGNWCTLLAGGQDEQVLGSIGVSKVIRPYNPAADETFNPADATIKPKARILKMRDFEADVVLRPKELQKTLLAYNGNQKRKTLKADAESLSFGQYLFQEAIIKRAQSDLLMAIIKGEFDDTGSNPEDVLDGLEAIIAAEILASTISPVVTATTTASNVITQAESVADSINDLYSGAEDAVCLMRPDIYKLWTRANRLSLGRESSHDSAKAMTFGVNDNIKIIPMPNMTAYKFIIFEKSNLVIDIRSQEEVLTPEIQFQDRQIKMMHDGAIGLNFVNMVDAKSLKRVAVGS